MLKHLIVVTLLMGYSLSASAADAKVEIRAGDNQFRMRVHKKGDRYYGRHNDRDYEIRGDSVRRITSDGEYVVHGRIDGDYIEARDWQPAEYRMRVTRRDGRHYGYYNNREYLLRGDSVTRITADGEYVVYGDIGADGTYFETREVAPSTVQQTTIVREVIVERPRDPLIKVGPLEIGR